MNPVRIEFSIAKWSWWAPEAGPPSLPELPPLMRRRASAADRAALRVAFDCVGASGSTPAVFCSRHGEVHRSVELLEQLVRGEPLSPNGFSLSVHNAAATLYSLARKDTSALSALGAGADTLHQGLLEAAGQLADGAPEVLVVAYDDALPAPFQPYAPLETACALALLLRPPERPSFSLELLAADAAELPGAAAERVAQFLGGKEAELHLPSGKRAWTWRRHA